jgi:peptidyl-prolyl cis-trans isomerase D
MASREIRRLKAKKGETVSEALEKKKESHPFIYVFSVIVLVVVVVTFVASPVAGRISGAGSIVFGSYAGKDIAYQPGNYFAQQRDRLAERVRQSGQSENVESQIFQIWRQAFDQTVIHTAMLVQVQTARMQVSDDRIDKALLTYPPYTDNGVFSEEAYRKVSLEERVRTRKMYREQLMTDQYTQDLFTGIKTGDREKEFISTMAKKERSFDFVSFLFSAYPVEEVRKYALANPDTFRKVKVSRILVKSGENEAKEIHKKLQDKSTSFEELARAHSKDAYAEKGGDMGWRYAYDLQADFDKKEQVKDVLALKTGEVSDVLKAGFGWMIFRCDSEAVDPDLSDTAVLDVVRGYILRYERGKVEDYFMAAAGKVASRAAQAGFPAAAREAGLATAVTSWFPINLQGVFVLSPLKATPDTATPSSALYSEEFFQKAFALGTDKVSSPIVLDDRIVVLKVAGERDMPEANSQLMKTFADYVANQSLQTDLQNELMDPKLLKDNFLDAFSRNVYRRPQAQQ